VKKFVVLICALFFVCNIYAQSSAQAYSIGDTFIDYVFKPINGDSASKFTFKSIKGKYVIIDLWDIHCSGCISGMLKLDSLQHLFPETLKVISVTRNSKKEVEELFSRIHLDLPGLPMIVSDTALYTYLFPHTGDPLHVWIDTSGVIKYITGGYNTTIDNIQKFMNNQLLHVAFQSEIKDFDPSMPLIEEAASRLKYYTKTYSVFTKGLQNVINTNRIEVLNSKSTNMPYLIKALNAPVLTLYQIAYNQELYGVTLNMFQFTRNNRISLESPRAKLLTMPKDIQYLDGWRDDNLFCYEILVPEKKSGEVYHWMQQDLKRFFDLSVTIQKKKMQCLVLVNIDRNAEVIVQSSIRYSNAMQSNNSGKYDNRPQMKKMITELIYLTQDFNLPFIDGTNDKTNLSIKFPGKTKSIQELNVALKELGLIILKKVREVDLLSIK